MEKQHALAASVEELIAPDTLSRLTGRSVSEVRRVPFTSVDGRSGIDLEAIETDGAGRYVLKRFSLQTDVVMRLTDDRSGRAVQIWQQGLLDRLPPRIVHGVVGSARDDDGWAILIQDFSGRMLPAHEQRLSEVEDAAVLDAMAALHETFWGDPPDRESYGLCAMRARYESLFPASLERESGPDAPPIGKYALDGLALLPEVVGPEIEQLVRTLHSDITPLIRALERYPQTLIHGDWHHGNIGLMPGTSPSVILLD